MLTRNPFRPVPNEFCCFHPRLGARSDLICSPQTFRFSKWRRTPVFLPCYTIRMDRSVLHLVICLGATALLGAHSAGPSVKQDVTSLVRRFESRYKAAHTLQATFFERYTENGRIVRVEAGTVFFRRPGKMRWEYESPEKNLFLIDGKTAWFYVPADHTATRVPARASTDWRTPLALLAGEMKVSRICAQVQTALDQTPEDASSSVLYCELRSGQTNSAEPGSPKNASHNGEPGEAVFFEVRDTGDLVRVLVKNPGGVEIEFHFKNWQRDPYLDDSLFRFSAPPGVAIVNGELPSGENVINP
jgi:outer membrane lipoprotein carrier protein